MKAMILAAGLGTRLKPWTDSYPKALAEVKGKSLLQRNIEYLSGFGIIDVIVNVHHFAEQVINAVQENNGWGSNVVISDESNEVLETGGGLKKAAWFFEGENDFVMMNADVLTNLDLQKMINVHQSGKALATLATRQRQTSRYLVFDDANRLCGWKNIKTGEIRPKPQFLGVASKNVSLRAFSGIQILSTTILPLISQQGKFSMIDVYLSLCGDHLVQSFDHSSGSFIDVGKPESLVQAQDFFRNNTASAG